MLDLSRNCGGGWVFGGRITICSELGVRCFHVAFFILSLSINDRISDYCRASASSARTTIVLVCDVPPAE